MGRGPFAAAVLAFGGLACGGEAPIDPMVVDPEQQTAELECHDCVRFVAGEGKFGFIDGDVKHARFELPRGLAVGLEGELYVADALNHVIRVVRDGKVETFAGSEPGFRDGPKEMAKFRMPAGIAVDAAGRVYVADSSNHRIRVIENGYVRTVVGTGAPGHVDGPRMQAELNQPVDVDVDDEGNIYVAELENLSIRKVELKIVRTLAKARLPGPWFLPRFVAVARNGVVYFTDGFAHVVRAILLDGSVRVVAGGEGPGFREGEARSAAFDEPTGIAIDARGTIYVGDEQNQRVRVFADGEVWVLAGSGYIGDEDGEDARHAKFDRPLGVALDRSTGQVYVSEAGRARIRVITPPL